MKARKNEFVFKMYFLANKFLFQACFSKEFIVSCFYLIICKYQLHKDYIKLMNFFDIFINKQAHYMTVTSKLILRETFFFLSFLFFFFFFFYCLFLFFMVRVWWYLILIMLFVLEAYYIYFNIFILVAPIFICLLCIFTLIINCFPIPYFCFTCHSDSIFEFLCNKFTL